MLAHARPQNRHAVLVQQAFDDLDLLLAWWRAFVREAIPQEDNGPAGDLRQVERRLAENGFALWEVDGVPVSLCGHGGATPNGIRIGPVYTPPALRGRGYATGLVAELSQALLDSGRTFCFLFTDLANPTSNAIYERIGYRRVCDSLMVAFEP